jgi:carboxypeptidase Q
MRSLGFANVHPEPVRVPHWERGVGVGEVTAPFAQSVALAALGGSVATPPDGVEAPVVEVDSLEAIDALAESAVRGRIVYVHRVMRRTRDGSGYGEAVSARTRSAIAAAPQGSRRRARALHRHRRLARPAHRRGRFSRKASRPSWASSVM